MKINCLTCMRKFPAIIQAYITLGADFYWFSQTMRTRETCTINGICEIIFEPSGNHSDYFLFGCRKYGLQHQKCLIILCLKFCGKKTKVFRTFFFCRSTVPIPLFCCCSSCLRSWLEQDTSCPTCRMALNERPEGDPNGNNIDGRGDAPNNMPQPPPGNTATTNHFFHFDGRCLFLTQAPVMKYSNL